MRGQKTGGRQKGTPNKSTAEIKLLARAYGPEAVKEIAKLAGLVKDANGDPIGASDNHQTRLAALNSLVDRGYGRPAQAVTGEDGEGPMKTELHIVWGRAGADQVGRSQP